MYSKKVSFIWTCILLNDILEMKLLNILKVVTIT